MIRKLIKPTTTWVVAGLLGTLFALPIQAETLPINSLSHTHGISVPTNQPGRLYMATHNGFFLASTDGSAERLAPISDDFMSLVADPANPAHLYASGHPRGGGNLGLLKSTDGGRNWKQISPGLNGPVDFHALTVSPVNPQRIYGMYRGLQISNDGGKSWKHGGKLPKQTHALGASSQAVDTLYAATGNGLKLSKDGGNSWRSAMMMRLPASIIHVAADGHAYTFLVGKGLMKLKEPGLGWKTIFNGFGDAIPRHLTSDVNDPSRLYTLDNKGHLWRSQDAGQSWQPFVEES